MSGPSWFVVGGVVASILWIIGGTWLLDRVALQGAYVCAHQRGRFRVVQQQQDVAA